MKYALKRILMLLVTMLIVSFLTFAAFALISGDPAEAMLGTEATPEQLAALRHELGLDRPFLTRYITWLAGFFSGDLGISLRYRQPVWDLMAPKLEVTLCLCLVSFIIITAVSIPLAIWSYRWVGGAFDWLRTAFNQLCMAVPPFFTGILASWLFGIVLRLFVPGDFPDLRLDPGGAVVHLFFASVCLCIPRCAMTVRMMRSTVIGEMEKAYVRTAISRGNDRHAVLTRHVLKNSLTATVTFLGQTMAACWWPPSPPGTTRWWRRWWSSWPSGWCWPARWPTSSISASTRGCGWEVTRDEKEDQRLPAGGPHHHRRTGSDHAGGRVLHAL